MSSDATRPAGAPARILVIDDEEVIHTSLGRILTKQGFTVEAVLSAPEGIGLLEQERFDLVITDLMMPEMNGIDLLAAMRERAIATPVIMITGYPTIRTAVQALRLGAMDYLPKPFTRQELLGPVRRALRQEGAATPPLMEAEGAPKPAELLPGATFFLAHHAWVRFEQDGTFVMGVEEDFLRAAGRIRRIATPEENDLVEQGHVSVLLVNDEDEHHGVSVPLTGQVVAVNRAAVAAPSSLGPADWLLRILPSQVDSELGLLHRRH